MKLVSYSDGNGSLKPGVVLDGEVHDIARLLPDAYHDDAIAAGDFRRFTEDRLRRRKLEHAATVTATLGREPGPLSEAEVAAWLGSLNDLRLVLGTLLDVAEDDDVDERLSDPDEDGYQIYTWLTWLQGHVVEALASRL